jgi:electron transport complex protein RnfD
MHFAIATSPHVHHGNSVPRVMASVLLALVPGIALMTAFLGVGVISNLLLGSVFALGFEALAMLARARSPGPAIADLSALVSAWLLALALPPLSPWWLLLVANGFAIGVAKHLYGGLGYNPFNPAMVGYVVALIAFPLEMTSWLAPAGTGVSGPGVLASLAAVFDGGAAAFDGATAATVLDAAKTEVARGRTLGEIMSGPAFGLFAGRGLEWANLAFLVGGLWLLWKKIIYWQIPVSMLAGLLLIASLFWVVDPGTYASPLFHLIGGASLIGAFFIATDPVSAAATPRGRLYFGAGIGILTYVIRTWGGYPDGVAFSVLLMNLVAPTIDHYTQPRVFGHVRNR